MKTRLLLLPLCLLVVLSCSKFTNPPDEPPKEGIAVQTIEATANFDLSARSDWKLTLQSLPYDFVVEGNRLQGTGPQGTPYVFPYNVEYANAQIMLFPPAYGRPRNEGTLPPIIENQSTPEKFMNCDPLRSPYTGTSQKHITGMQFYHYNALLDFETVGLPPGSKVFIGQCYNQKISPLRDAANPNVWKAIILPQNTNVMIIVEHDGQTYTAPLFNGQQTRSPIYPEGIGSSAHITFSVRFDDEGRLITENVVYKPWVKDWPITQ